MPTYEFKCPICGFSKEYLIPYREVIKMKEKPPICPKCRAKGRARKMDYQFPGPRGIVK